MYLFLKFTKNIYYREIVPNSGKKNKEYLGIVTLSHNLMTKLLSTKVLVLQGVSNLNCIDYDERPSGNLFRFMYSSDKFFNKALSFGLDFKCPTLILY